MSKSLSKFDAWLDGTSGPAALVLREHLMPVEGNDAALFPPTFASGDGFAGGYNIDPPPTKEDPWKTPNVCLIDSVGSQANRIEPIFSEEAYQHLIPQVIVKAGDREVNLLDAGHRAGDALLRCSELQAELRDAFRKVQLGDSEPMAKIAPTSLVFGVWDSRDTQAKLPRLVSSVIRAYDVRPMTRSAVYIPPVDYSSLEVFTEAEKAKAEGSSKSPQAQRGFVHNPASGAHGGVLATGGIRRDATLSLAALQLIKVGTDRERTLALRRYVLGLSLVALTVNTSAYLRQGCTLVIDPEKGSELLEVYRDGRREPAKLTHEDALAIASEAAKQFGVGESRSVEFDKKLAKADVASKK